jgi:hypothetical protein
MNVTNNINIIIMFKKNTYIYLIVRMNTKLRSVIRDERLNSALVYKQKNCIRYR